MQQIPKRVVISSIAALVIIIIFIYLAYLSHKQFEATIVYQTQGQLLAIARTAAKSLEEFIAGYAEALKTIAKNPHFQEELHLKFVHGKPDSKYCLIKTFYEVHKENVDAITVFDANGIMLHRHPFMENRPGMDHTDKPGVAYVIKEHATYVSQVFYTNLGKPAMSISEPVFHKGEFAGIVRWMIQTDTISKRSIQLLKAGKEGFVVLLDENGRFLSHPARSFGDRTCFDVLADNKKHFPGHDWSGLNKMQEERSLGKEGVAIINYATTGENKGTIKVIKRITGYAPVALARERGQLP
ncbi:MAG: cache domain-containing protein [Pseudomonadota bacterium]